MLSHGHCCARTSRRHRRQLCRPRIPTRHRLLLGLSSRLLAHQPDEQLRVERHQHLVHALVLVSGVVVVAAATAASRCRRVQVVNATGILINGIAVVSTTTVPPADDDAVVQQPAMQSGRARVPAKEKRECGEKQRHE